VNKHFGHGRKDRREVLAPAKLAPRKEMPAALFFPDSDVPAPREPVLYRDLQATRVAFAAMVWEVFTVQETTDLLVLESLFWDSTS